MAQLSCNLCDISQSDATGPVRVSEIANSQLQGCRGCEIVLKGLDMTYKWAEEGLKDPPHHQGKFLLYNRKGMQDTMFESLVREPHEISGDTGSPEAFAWASKQMENCLLSHARCKNIPPTFSPLPTRVVDLGASCGGGLPCAIKLLETNGMSARYSCLSYCWGKATFLNTTRENIEQHKRHIEWSSLPKTFQEAIFFVRKLGLRYLWIDSLCILQNDKEDWERESGSMCSNFRNAAITISATKSGDSHGGLFSHPSPAHRLHKISTQESGEGGVCIRAPIWHGFLDAYDNQSSLEVYPLQQRAWVYQERMLSSRILHFSPHEMIFECISEVACECGMVDPSRSAKLRTHSEWARHQSFAKASPFAEQYYLRSWYQSVQAYSALSLSFEKDRLPAFSGIARYFQGMMPQKYLAGLWCNSLFQDLLWQKSHPQAPSRISEIPTWSWASLPGRVFFPVDPVFSSMEQRCTIEATGELAGPGETGAVKSSYLQMSGLVIPVTTNGLLRNQDVEIHVDGVLCKGSLKMDIQVSDNDNLRPESERNTVLFGVAEDRIGVYFLVLHRLTTSPVQYERIGLVRLMNPEKGKPLYMDWNNKSEVTVR